MNLYEFEGKELLSKYGIKIPKGVVVRPDDNVEKAYKDLGVKKVAVKAQILSGKRGKNQGISFCNSAEEVKQETKKLFTKKIRKQNVPAVLIEEFLDIASEHFISITYDTNEKQPVLLFSSRGGVDIEKVDENEIQTYLLDVRKKTIDLDLPAAEKLWTCFLEEDLRLAEINPLVETAGGKFVAADAKAAIDDDAFYRHEEWAELEPRTMMGRPPTAREVKIEQIDKGQSYYRGTAGKYIELDGDIAILFSGGGASISNMDALISQGLQPANYTEYSGNPPREKVRDLARIVLTKPGLKGLWIAGGVANFTDVKETFHGIVDVLDELKPTYPIVVRRAGPNEQAGIKLLKDCAERNDLQLQIFGKEISMGKTARTLANMIKETA